MVNRLSEPSSALIDALTLAEQLNRGASNALASIKTLVNEASQRDLAEQLALERTHFVRNLHHPNAGRGIDAFLAKQPPQFE